MWFGNFSHQPANVLLAPPKKSVWQLWIVTQTCSSALSCLLRSSCNDKVYWDEVDSDQDITEILSSRLRVFKILHFTRYLKQPFTVNLKFIMVLKRVWTKSRKSKKSNNKVAVVLSKLNYVSVTLKDVSLNALFFFRNHLRIICAHWMEKGVWKNCTLHKSFPSPTADELLEFV